MDSAPPEPEGKGKRAAPLPPPPPPPDANSGGRSTAEPRDKGKRAAPPPPPPDSNSGGLGTTARKRWADPLAGQVAGGGGRTVPQHTACRVVAHRPERFDVGTQQAELLQHLEQHGYAVVAAVADSEQIAHSKSLMWDFLEGAVPGSGVDRHEPESWGSASWVPSSSTGIIQGHGFGQSDFAWSVRLLPKVKAAFAAIWGTDDLLVSFVRRPFCRRCGRRLWV